MLVAFLNFSLLERHMVTGTVNSAHGAKTPNDDIYASPRMTTSTQARRASKSHPAYLDFKLLLP